MTPEAILAVRCFNCDSYFGDRTYGWCFAFEIFIAGDRVCVKWQNENNRTVE
jgi:hypothetical protein